MGKIWSLMFLLVPVLGTAVIVLAVLDVWPFQGHWFPELVVADRNFDHLFNVILWLTGIVFVGTGLALFWFMWRYDSAVNDKPIYSHGNHFVELVWSVIPAIILLFLAVYQMDAWAGARMRRPEMSDGKPQPPLARVKGRQFEWRFQYPGEDGSFDTPDDIHVVNELHVPVNEDVVLEIESLDVLHSFFLPHFRVKQDVVPGMRQIIWFHPIKQGSYDIVCAELCGWGHYKMKGQITVEDRADLEQYLRETYRLQEQTEYIAADDR